MQVRASIFQVPNFDLHACTHLCRLASGAVAASTLGVITLRLSDNLFEGGTGCHQWEAGFLMADFVLGHQELFKGGQGGGRFRPSSIAQIIPHAPILSSQ